MKYLVDTNQIIYAINNSINIKAGFYYISFITEIELLSYPKLDLEEEIKIKQLLQCFNIIDVNTFIKDNTITIRRKTHLKIPDALIVATALYLDATLVTNDKEIARLNFINTITIDELVG
jgi:hypothetical protein